MTEITEQDRLNVLTAYYNQAVAGSERALIELSQIAFGGNIEAQRLVRTIDSKKIRFADEEPTINNRPSLIEKVFRPIANIINTKIRQELVGADLAQAPPPYESGCSQEEFPNLSLFRANGILNRAKKRESMESAGTKKVQCLNNGGVPFEAWSKTDQELLRQGKKPRGAPLHPNI